MSYNCSKKLKSDIDLNENDMDSVGKMQEEALKRKERLKALKEKKSNENSESPLEGEQLPKYENLF